LGEVILDPFFGSGTTGAVAKRLQRHWIGIETEESYIAIAQQRIDGITPDQELIGSASADQIKKRKRVPFISLLQQGLLREGQVLYFGPVSDQQAYVLSNGEIQYRDISGSIHYIGREISHGPCNGWLAWYYIDEATGKRQPIDMLRKNINENSKVADRQLQVNSEE
jgi:modification methylase